MSKNLSEDAKHNATKSNTAYISGLTRNNGDDADDVSILSAFSKAESVSCDDVVESSLQKNCLRADSKSQKCEQRSDLVSMLHQFEHSTGHNAPILTGTKVSIQLLQMLRKAQAPLYLFNDIMLLMHSTLTEQPDLFVEHSLKNDSVIDLLFERYHVHGLKPEKQI